MKIKVHTGFEKVVFDVKVLDGVVAMIAVVLTEVVLAVVFVVRFADDVVIMIVVVVDEVLILVVDVVVVVFVVEVNVVLSSTVVTAGKHF